MDQDGQERIEKINRRQANDNTIHDGSAAKVLQDGATAAPGLVNRFFIFGIV